MIDGACYNELKKCGVSWDMFNEDDHSPFYLISIDGSPVGVISYGSYYDAFYDSYLPRYVKYGDKLRLVGSGVNIDRDVDIEDIRETEKKIMWVKLLEFFDKGGIERVFSVWEKLEDIARKEGMEMIMVGASMPRVKQMYTRFGFRDIRSYL